MLKQNIDLELLRSVLGQIEAQRRLLETQEHLLRHVIDQVEAHEVQNLTRDRRIYDIEQKCEEILQKVDFLEDGIPQFRYLAGRNAELEAMADPYSPDGDPICNS